MHTRRRLCADYAVTRIIFNIKCIAAVPPPSYLAGFNFWVRTSVFPRGIASPVTDYADRCFASDLAIARDVIDLLAATSSYWVWHLMFVVVLVTLVLPMLS